MINIIQNEQQQQTCILVSWQPGKILLYCMKMKHPTPHHELDLDAPASQGWRTAVLLQNIKLKYTY